jgi:hypothetical protein
MPEQCKEYALIRVHMCSVVANRDCQSAISRDLIHLRRQNADDFNELSKTVMLAAWLYVLPGGECAILRGTCAVSGPFCAMLVSCIRLACGTCAILRGGKCANLCGAVSPPYRSRAFEARL